MVNVLMKVPQIVQSRGKEVLQDTWMAKNRADAYVSNLSHIYRFMN